MGQLLRAGSGGYYRFNGEWKKNVGKIDKESVVCCMDSDPVIQKMC